MATVVNGAGKTLSVQPNGRNCHDINVPDATTAGHTPFEQKLESVHLIDSQGSSRRLEGINQPPNAFIWLPNGKAILRRGNGEGYFRHAHASLLLRQGVHPKVVQERLGHTRIGTTMDVYSHIIPGMQEEAVELLDRILEAK